jgi:hypothetical protein
VAKIYVMRIACGAGPEYAHKALKVEFAKIAKDRGSVVFNAWEMDDCLVFDVGFPNEAAAEPLRQIVSEYSYLRIVKTGLVNTEVPQSTG